MSDVVARRYAQALIDVAPDAKAVDAIATSLDRFVAVSTEGVPGRRLDDVLSNPVFTHDERRTVLDQVLARLDLHPLAANLLRLANDKRRLGILPKIAEAYRDLADQRAGRQRVTVQTAEPLTPQLESEVRAAIEAMTGKSVLLRAEVRPDLIGGLVARIGDKVFDSSIRTRLELLQQQLLSAPIVAQA
jgi:F-type H+-transporting ATPase subunit delta